MRRKKLKTKSKQKGANAGILQFDFNPFSAGGGGKDGKKKDARSSFIPTDMQRMMVMLAGAVDLRSEEIRKWIINPATGLPITPETFKKVFAEELLTGLDKATLMVTSSLFRRAMTERGMPGVLACKFWLQAKAGWKETQVNEHTGTVEVEGAKKTLEDKLTRVFGLGSRAGQEEGELPEVKGEEEKAGQGDSRLH